MGWVGAKGYGWCATHFHDNPRADNAAGSNLVVIDFDGDTADKFWATTTAQGVVHCDVHICQSHRKEHRFRALFYLAKDLDTPTQHRGAYWLIVNRLLAELGLDELKDNCGQKPERLWYGNTNAVVQTQSQRDGAYFLLADIDYDDTVEYTQS